MSHRIPSHPLPRSATRKPDTRRPVLELSAEDRALLFGTGSKGKKAPTRPKKPKLPPPPSERETEARPNRKREPGPWVIVLEWDLGRTNPNKRPGKWGKITTNTAARRAARFAWYDAGRPESDGPVVVELVVQRARKLDQANIWAAMKPCLDGIFVDGITRDDNEEWLTLGAIRQEPSPQWKGRERVLVHVRLVTPLEPEA